MPKKLHPEFLEFLRVLREILLYLIAVFAVFFFIGYLLSQESSVEALATTQPMRIATFIGEYKTTGYYSPVPGQSRYYVAYEYDEFVNCFGSCFTTANGMKLDESMAMQVIACPPNIALGTTLHIYGLGDVVCQDRG